MSEPNARTVVCRILGVRRRRAATDSFEGDRAGGAPAAADVFLSIEQTAYVSPGAVDLVGTLESVQRANLYIYLDLDAHDFIRGYAIAHSGFVSSLTETEEGYLVELERQPTAFFIPMHPDPAAMVSTIRSAESTRQPIALRNASYCDPLLAAQTVPSTPDMERSRVGVDPCVDSASLTPVTREQAMNYFELLAAFTCPTASKCSCVPTYYVVMGCQARAHRFCNILSELPRPVRAAKKWAWARFMAVEPPNMPCCRVLWNRHVAVALRARDREGYYVLDHALFEMPVTEDTWLDKLVHPAKESQISSALAFDWEGPTLKAQKEIQGDTEEGLFRARAMQEDMILNCGSPPYHTCCITSHAAIPGSADPAACSRAAARTPYAPG
jgi:hypothetical protein